MRSHRLAGAAIVAAGLLATTSAFALPALTVTQFDAPGADPGSTQFTGIAPTTGAVVGTFTTNNGTVTDAFIKNGNNLTILNNQPGFSALGASQAVTPFGINDAGIVSGDFVLNSNTNAGFIANNGVFKVFNQPGATESFPGGINNTGVVAGQFIDNTVNHLSHAFTENQNGSGFTQIDVPGATGSSGFNVNNHGDVVGEAFFSTGAGQRGFLLHNGAFTTIDHSTFFTLAAAINDAGLIVGNFEDSSNKLHGFFDDNGAFSQFDALPGTTETLIAGIDNNGDIVGTFRDANRVQHAFEGLVPQVIVTAAPEPATLTLLAGGLLALGLVRRRKAASA
jgi:uncharacterized membrane protein